MYYYLTTLDEEFKHYSKRKVTLATLLYVTNRYVPLANAIYGAPWFTLSSNKKICAGEWGIGMGLEMLQYFPWAIFSALRTFALQRKLCWAAIVLILSLASVIVSSIRERWAFTYEDPVNGCVLSDTISPIFQHSSPHIPVIGPALARAPMIIADIIVVIITWKTQYKTYSLGKKLPSPMRLTRVILRDGEFPCRRCMDSQNLSILTILNTLQLVFEYSQVFATTVSGQAKSSDLVIFVEPLTAILISEFLAHLHEAADLASEPGTLASVSALEFRMIGSIGASLPRPGGVGALDGAGESGPQNTESSQESWNGAIVSSGVGFELEELARDEAEV
ncbi:hypothetical protein GY45DRAFT_1332206 [Cubamyces sp. BRFM 1775]|nr:hypothetical protein GY45DRAFT_1332206 [Cubamyces sp. BRFM 1775]